MSGITLPDPQGDMTLAAAFAHHKAGRLAEAEAIYRSILVAEPQHVRALHLLGVLARQARRPAIAVSLLLRAVGLDGKVAELHNDLGAALLDLGDLDAAMKSFMRALQLRPRYPDAVHNMANLLARMGKDEDAVTCYRAVLALEPRHAAAASNLGAALGRSGRLDGVVAR